MCELWVPFEGDGKGAANVLVSADVARSLEQQSLDSPNKNILVLMQGTGEVRAGVWARSVNFIEGFRKGSMIPFVEWAEANS